MFYVFVIEFGSKLVLQKWILVWYNRLVKWILSSPLQRLLSKNTMLISFQGRTSGKKYTLPVNYIQDSNTFLVTSYRHRTWWRNLRGGVSVTLRVQGQTLKGIGEALTREADVIKHLQDYLKKVPTHAKYFNVSLNPDGTPNVRDITQIARDRVGIRVELKSSLTHQTC